MSDRDRKGAHLRLLPPLTEEEALADARAELARYRRQITEARIDRTTASHYNEESNPEGGKP